MALAGGESYMDYVRCLELLEFRSMCRSQLQQLIFAFLYYGGCLLATRSPLNLQMRLLANQQALIHSKSYFSKALFMW